jgi:hypothetical protein
VVTAATSWPETVSGQQSEGREMTGIVGRAESAIDTHLNNLSVSGALNRLLPDGYHLFLGGRLFSQPAHP